VLDLVVCNFEEPARRDLGVVAAILESDEDVN
jgi:hypothetical protein